MSPNGSVGWTVVTLPSDADVTDVTDNINIKTKNTTAVIVAAATDFITVIPRKLSTVTGDTDLDVNDDDKDEETLRRFIL